MVKPPDDPSDLPPALAGRVRALNDHDLRPDGEHVLYWMTAARRSTWNHALDRALAHARALGRPLIVLEALGCRHAWANDRSHRWLLQGMADNARAFGNTPVLHHAWVERRPGEGRGLVEALADGACVVVGDDWPSLGLPRLQTAAARRLDVRFEVVDANGLLPMREPERVFTTAHSFRRFLQGRLADLLTLRPAADPLRGLGLPRARLPAEVARRWPAETPEALLSPGLPGEIDIDHGVPPVAEVGGPRSARQALTRFLDGSPSGAGLEAYADDRNHPDHEATSGFSPWLHFGHLSAQEVVQAVLDREGGVPDDLPRTGRGDRAGWWGLSASAEAFLDQLVTWRELGFNMAAQRPDHDRWESLPAWARETLDVHSADERERLYTLEEFEQAGTHDELWNAAMRQLRVSGRMHNYLRMLWGKQILAWTRDPREALAVMFELNNRWALDGRDPNSTSGICWTLGRYDRAWGPERPVFGKIRYMTSRNTRRKLRVSAYLDRWSGAATT